MDTFLEHGYVDTFRRFNQEPGNYSWWDQMTRARIGTSAGASTTSFTDADFAPRLTDAFILPNVMGSDHCPVGIEIA